MMNPKFSFIESINLGTDSKLDLVSVNNTKYIIKTYLGVESVMKRNREFQFHQELKQLDLLSFEFNFLDLVDKQQLCFKYIDNLKTFSDFDDVTKFELLSNFMNKLHSVSKSKIDYDNYYNWLKTEIKTAKVDSKYIDKASKIIDNLSNQNENLTLLHSDFHTNNIGLVNNNQVLLFDSGHCPYLFGHHYHDLSRIMIYHPEGIMLEGDKIEPSMLPFFKSIKDQKTFIEFCYIQSLMMNSNQYVTTSKEVMEYLFTII
jgi:Ecdysteroid kinase-like family